MEEINQSEPNATIEKINFSEIEDEKSKIRFEEQLNNMLNDEEFKRDSLRYVKKHLDELKEIYPNTDFSQME